MLIKKSETGDQCIKDIWANYRKKEVQVEMRMFKSLFTPEPEPETISKKEGHTPAKEGVLFSRGDSTISIDSFLVVPLSSLTRSTIWVFPPHPINRSIVKKMQL